MTDQREEFRRGLYPILVARDSEQFKTYLRRWEEVIGDTAELAETPDGQVRRTMDALLRRPQQFNLPAWPRDLVQTGMRFRESSPSAVEDRPLDVTAFTDAARRSGSRPELEATPQRDVGLRVEGGHDAGDFQNASDFQSAAGAPGDDGALEVTGNQAEREEGSGSREAYQLNMLTGELVPVQNRSVRATLPPALAEEEVSAPRQKRVRRPRVAKDMRQLELWSEE
jgi:hypothetical protein